MNNNISNNNIHDDDLELEKKGKINETTRANFSNYVKFGKSDKNDFKVGF
ncbi:MAG: hypothetical protein ACM3XP_05525 [Nitrososphaerales archaeon]